VQPNRIITHYVSSSHLQRWGAMRNLYGSTVLTRREQQIADLICEGYSNPQIASFCDISEETVKRHLSNIFDKMGCFTRVELVLMSEEKRKGAFLIKRKLQLLQCEESETKHRLESICEQIQILQEERS
jgi:DNA-binding CsgD family transcriptional regulator